MYQRVLDRYDRGGRDRRAKGREFQSGRGGSFLGIGGWVRWYRSDGGLVGRNEWWFWEGNVVVGMMRKAVVSLGMVGMAVVVV